MENEKKINEEQLNDVNGGGLFDKYSDDEYEAAGMEVVGSGFFYNDGYRFKGQDISDDDAIILVKYNKHFGSVAPSVEDPRAWWKYHCS